MAIFVLVAWIVQAAVGVWLLVGWIRHGRGASASAVLSHVVLGVAGLAMWIAFVQTDALAWAWLAFAAMTIGNAIGDSVMLIGRTRRLRGESLGFWRDYGAAVSATFRGEFPRHVVFHTLFSAVVYFPCLGVCIGATVAAAS